MSQNVAKVLSIKNLDAEFEKHPNPIIINDLPTTTMEDREHVRNLVITTYDKTDSLSSVPSCSCRRTTRGDNVGTICLHCGTEVTTTANRKLEPDLFIRTPEGITRMVNPKVWTMLYKHMNLGKTTNGLTYITNRHAKPPTGSKRADSFLQAFKDSGLERGYNAFVNNFDDYYMFILSTINNYELRDDFAQLYAEHRHNFFTNYLPIPSKVAFVVEVAHVGTYYCKSMDAIIEAVYTAADIKNNRDMRRVESLTATIQDLVSRYYLELYSKIMSSKPGILRRACYGNRCNFSWRNIVTSSHGIHRYDQIRIPYDLGLTMLQPMVLNKLVHKHGMTIKEAYDYTETHATDMDPFLLSILDELVAESKDERGIMSIFIRYPSLARSSSQCLYICGFTKHSTEISVLSLVGPNCDSTYV